MRYCTTLLLFSTYMKLLDEIIHRSEAKDLKYSNNTQSCINIQAELEKLWIACRGCQDLDG